MCVHKDSTEFWVLFLAAIAKHHWCAICAGGVACCWDVEVRQRLLT